MTIATNLNTEKETQFFPLAYVSQEGFIVVEIQEIDMSGWTVLQCYFPLQDDVVYFEWDDNNKTVTLMDMDEADQSGDYTILMDKIQQLKCS